MKLVRVHLLTNDYRTSPTCSIIIRRPFPEEFTRYRLAGFQCFPFDLNVTGLNTFRFLYSVSSCLENAKIASDVHLGLVNIFRLGLRVTTVASCILIGLSVGFVTYAPSDILIMMLHLTLP